jgi:hypothetical protein
MGTRLPLDAPAKPQERRQDAPRLAEPQLAHVA